ncbi:allophanate hydrolase [Virgisporangium aurantiacum]|uniref:Allophanate hydrolase n=1 Tax=Virgisporangium aurantiacum TaxID=175570 RepID=A0A8J3Z226_9ACTN|nr:allophanate hydrolase [Virgisporangium aurantiacum]GIJ55844.1 allophanate hydrolase [Virgisporangium aurantiacum]
MSIAALRAAYATGVTPRSVLDGIDTSDDTVWITRADALAAADDLPRRWPDPANRPPLYGIPFSVKDNIDVAGLPTTAACPDFAYTPTRSAPLVDRLLHAGAILVGKNNLDQFATGLTGARSPYGTPRNPFDTRYITGGSSSGSAVAVATGAVSFSIGTDTAGSGRVPAALCDVVGLKPSRGLVSTLGIVPACPSLDCPSVFAPSVADATTVLDVIAGYEPADPWSRRLTATTTTPAAVGVPENAEFGGDRAAERLFADAIARLERTGVTLVPVDLEPFLAAGRLLYQAWVAERWTHLGAFVTAHPDSVHPVTRRVLTTATTYSAADAFAAMHRLRALRAETAPVWATVDALMIPTVPTTYTIDEIEADPFGRNAFLGHYTQFANLLDLAGIAVPAGFTPAGLPFGVQFLAPAGHDTALAALASRFEAHAEVLLAVVGAHRTGQPLHHELAVCGAVPVGPMWTAKHYRLFALDRERPGLVRVESGGAPVEVEVHRISTAGLGRLLAGVPAPLGLGRVELADGSTVVGFLAESYAVAGAPDITEYGSWPAYIDARISRPST